MEGGSNLVDQKLDLMAGGGDAEQLEFEQFEAEILQAEVGQKVECLKTSPENIGVRFHNGSGGQDFCSSDMIEIVPVVKKEVVNGFQDGSVVSSCSSSRSKMSLFLELNIQPKDNGTFAVAGGSSGQNISGKMMEPDVKHEPITVRVDYPDDIKISVNAKIIKTEIDSRSCTPSTSNNNGKIVDEVDGKQWAKGNEIDQNGNEVLNSTFVKPVPLTSTLIYPILEEIESAGEEKQPEASQYFARSRIQEGDSSFYQTVLGDNGFGNLSAIIRTESEENHEKASQEPSGHSKSKRSKLYPSLSLNTRSSFPAQTEDFTPGEKLIKALHILARYRGVWGIYEDDERIVKHLRKIHDLLSVTDSATVQRTCKEDEYQEVNGLVSYFVLEKRFVIRSELLQIFALLVEKSPAVAEYVFASEFPMVLAWEIERGNYVSKETYDYAHCFLQIINSTQLSSIQCESIGVEFYSKIVGMLFSADRNHYGRVAELFFDIALRFHAQLPEETELKWKSVCLLGGPNRNALKKYKHRIINTLMKTASAMSSVMDPNQTIICERKIRDVLAVLKDLIICNATKGMFSNAELDIILVTVTNNLEENHQAEHNLEALKTIHRILLTISTEPSGLGKLARLVKRLLKDPAEGRGAGGDNNEGSCYRGVLKKIYKIITM